MRTILLSILSLALLFTSCRNNASKVDLVIKNAMIYTVDESQPKAEAMAVSNGKIVAIGPEKEIEPFFKRAAKVIDAGGKAVIPGLIDSHAHFLGLGASLLQLNLNNVQSWDEVIAMVKDAVQSAQPGQWITGRGWHQEKWQALPETTVKGFPVHNELSKISPDNPVFLRHASGHALFANQKAMQLSGVNAESIDPDGGEIIRFADKKPTGVFLENAELLIQDVYGKEMNQRTEEEIEQKRFQKFQKAAQLCLQSGITSFYDAGSTLEDVDFFKKLADEKKLPIRLWLMLHEENSVLKDQLTAYRLINYGNKFLTVRAIKRYMDGALGARGAWLLKPYTDQPNTSGLNTIAMDEFEESAELAARHGFQLCTHAIGDRANREVINIYEKFVSDKPQQDLRWRIEHVQHLNPAEIPRFAKLGIIAAMQGIHCTSDGPWVPKRIGHERSEQGAYVWRKLKEAGAIICNGTDAPVEAVDPFANFYALVTRKMADGTTFYPEQVMTRTEALKSYTLDGAYSGFEEEFKGSLVVGKVADFVILSDNIMEIPEERIPSIKVEYTVVGGKIRYEMK